MGGQEEKKKRNIWMKKCSTRLMGTKKTGRSSKKINSMARTKGRGTMWGTRCALQGEGKEEVGKDENFGGGGSRALDRERTEEGWVGKRSSNKRIVKRESKP